MCVRRGGQEALEDGRLAEVEGGRVEPAPGGSDLRESDAKVWWGIGRLEVDVCGNAETFTASGRGGRARGRRAAGVLPRRIISETLVVVVPDFLKAAKPCAWPQGLSRDFGQRRIAGQT